MYIIPLYKIGLQQIINLRTVNLYNKDIFNS